VSAHVLANLRAKVRAIERHPPVLEPAGEAGPGWTFGDGTAEPFPGLALDIGGLHEIKPASAGSAGHGGAAAADALAIGFALRLAVRRLACLTRDTERSGLPTGGRAPLIVWCWSSAQAAECGRLHGPGLAELGLDPSGLLLVETARAVDALWSIEEAIRSGAAALVMGVMPAADLTAARRLSLAAQTCATPCLLVTGSAHPAAPATASRFRVGPVPSVHLPSMNLPSARPASSLSPGARSLEALVEAGFRASITLERCQSARGAVWDRSFALEWCDETHRFRSLAVVGDRERVREPRSRGAGHQQRA
jgi:protein ImuA